VIDFLLQGLVLGLAAAFSPGPFQTFLISQALANGWRRAAPVAFAPLISDGPIIIAILLVLDQLPANLLRFIGVIGGLFVFYLAWGLWQQWRKGAPGEVENFKQHVMVEGSRKTLFRGVLMNLLSPGPYTFWSLVSGPILLSALRQSPLHGSTFLFGFYGALIGGMLGIAAIFHLVRRLGPSVVRGLTLASIIILIAFGGVLVQRGIWG
jgi:threonine/homoserine/homoserine lactone efflux protein